MTAKPIQFDIITVFPQFFESPFGFGILARAIAEDRVRVQVHNLRDFTTDRHKTVDDRPFGGGEGMVLKAEPLFRAVESLGIAGKSVRDSKRERVVLLSAQGKSFTQAVARELAQVERIVFLCGRYEGVDERVNEMLADTELSIGDYVISGGELAAAVIVDAVSRLLPGVLGNEDSARYESFAAESAALDPAAPSEGDVSSERPHPRSTCDSGGLLDYPHYTRPPEFRGAEVPAVLCSGNHEDIRRWRRRQSLSKTLQNRPELLVDAALTDEDRTLLNEMRHET
ncbi:MAG TPA: tRNA (guanosine(37)-N1)-methyltransferase TrmD [Acidobacteriaceae bacterium]|nr:tRNA (guanosine(37)-N1)-methyltransferase TrmD [Acidobacteriaceae bacterium]